MNTGKTLIFYFLLTFLLFINNGKIVSAQQIKNPFSMISRGDTLYISIKSAVTDALKRNPTVTIQALEQDKAKSLVSLEISSFEPQITASATQSKSELQRLLGTRVEPLKMSLNNNQYLVGITEVLPTGTNISANASMSGQVSSLYTDQFSGNVGFTITQSLLQGFGLGAGMANLRKANIDLDITNMEMKAIAEQLVADVEKTYWEYYLASQEINIQKKSMELAEKQLQETMERVNVGKLSELEIAAVNAEVAQRKEALIDAQSNYEQVRLKLIHLLNPGDTDQWSKNIFTTDSPFDPADSLDTVENHEKIGLKYRPDLIQAKLSLKKGEVDVVKTRNGLLPKMDFFITFARTSYSQSFGHATPDISSPFYNINGGFNFALPLTDRNARAAYKYANTSKKQLELSLENMQRMVQLDIRSSYIEVLRSREQIDATKITRSLQEKKLDAELEKFRVGKSTNFLVLQAQRDFISSQLDEARSMVSYLNSLINLYQMEGTLLDRRGINAAY